MTTIYLVRHGLTQANKENRFAGRTYEQLHPEGVEQIRQVGIRLQDKNIGGIFCGPLPRTLQSAEIATLSLMAVLDEQGFQVAYPGLVRRIMLESGRLYLGEVTSDLREEIRDQAEVDWILTGTVEEFRSGGGVNPNPNVALGCRLLDASSGQIVWMDGADRLGTDSETVFNQGRVFSAADLTREIFRSLVAAFSPHTPGGTKG